MKHRKRGLSLIFIVILLCLFLTGCKTTFTTKYYHFTGRVVNKDTGKGIPNAEVYIAEKTEDFYSSPRQYNDQVPSWSTDVSKAMFGREAANRRLFFITDEYGRFSTVWRKDCIYSWFTPSFFTGRKISAISFAVNVPGYGQEMKRFHFTEKNTSFRSGEKCYHIPENSLKDILVEKTDRAYPVPGPIYKEHLRPRLPGPPEGRAREYLISAETAFNLQEYERALEIIKKGLEYAPSDPLLLLLRLDTLSSMGRIEDVLKEGRRYVSLYPRIGYAHKILADAAFESGEKQYAEQHYLECFQLDPELMNGFTALFNKFPQHAPTKQSWGPITRIWK